MKLESPIFSALICNNHIPRATTNFKKYNLEKLKIMYENVFIDIYNGPQQFFPIINIFKIVLFNWIRILNDHKSLKL